MFEQAIINAVCEKALREIAKGNNNALAMIYDKMHKLIYSVAWSVLKNHEDAEDILQNTLCEIVRSAKNYKGGNPKYWILSIARNQALTLARKKSRETPLEQLESPKETQKTDIESEFIYLDALSKLNSREREAVVLKVYCSLKHKEIAEILEITPSAAEKLYQRAITKLKDYYK